MFSLYIELRRAELANLDASEQQRKSVLHDGKESAYKAGDWGLIPGSGRSGGGHSNPLQYSCLETPMDRKAWWATVHGVAKSRTRLTD